MFKIHKKRIVRLNSVSRCRHIICNVKRVGGGQNIPK